MKTDGSVVIETTIDESGIDKGIANIEKKLKDLEDKPKTGTTINYIEKLKKSLSDLYNEKAKVNDQKLGFMEQVKEANILANQYENMANKYVQLKSSQLDGFATEKDISDMNNLANSMQHVEERIEGLIGGEMVNTQEVLKEQEQIAQLSNKLYDLLLVYEEMDKQKIYTDADIEAMEDLEEKIRKVRQELEKITGQKVHIEGFDDVDVKADQVDRKIKNIHTSSTNVLKKIAQWGLAILGIRGAFTFVRQAMSSVLSNNEKLKAQYDGMKQSLYGAFAPVIEKIINLMRTLMAYANYIWKRLFGKELFADTVKNSSKTAKNVKEITKQLAAFDEANVLNDNKSSGSGSGSGKTNLGLKDIEIPDWLKNLMDWINKHPKLAGIIFGTLAFTLFGGWSLASGIGGAISGLVSNLGTLALLAATAYVIYLDYKAIKEAVSAYNDLINKQKILREHTQTNAQENIKLDDSFVQLVKEGKATNEEMNMYTGHIRNVVRENNELRNSSRLTKEEKAKLREETHKLLNTYAWLYEQGELTEKQEYDYYKFLKDEFPDGINKTNVNLMETADVFNQLDKKYNTQYEIELRTKGENSVSSAINTLGDKFAELGKKIKKALDIGDVVGLKMGSVISSVFHAEGGIVNMPGRGVPINHIAGEAGREGIIPMDNQQQMEVLGQAIAKYVNITNYVTNNIDSRKLNQILKQSENKERLANNW